MGNWEWPKWPRLNNGESSEKKLEKRVEHTERALRDSQTRAAVLRDKLRAANDENARLREALASEQREHTKTKERPAS